MEKSPCPHCGEMNYENAVVCWACGKALVARPEPPRPPEPAPSVELTEAERRLLESAAAVTAPAPPSATVAPPAAPVSEAEPGAPAVADGGPKPAEREAATLREKEYVTPPVEVAEGPRGPLDWLVFAGQWVVHQVTAFKQALDDYDASRGRKSGNFSSFSCLLVVVILAVFLILFVALGGYLLRQP